VSVAALLLVGKGISLLFLMWWNLSALESLVGSTVMRGVVGVLTW